MLCGSSCGTFMVNIVVTYWSFTSWKIQPHVTAYRHQLPPIISLMCGFSVYILIIMKSNFDRGLHNLIMLIKKTTKSK